VHWNAEALQAMTRRFPAALKEQKNDYVTLPLNYTVRQALNFIESKVSDRVKEQKAYIDLMSSITTCVYVSFAEGPVTYLKEMEHGKPFTDILSESSHVEFEYSWDTLIINCQTKICSSGKHNNSYLRLIEDKWENDILTRPIIGRWVRFKALYLKELQKLTDDGIDNKAMNVQRALIAQVDAFESRYESDVQTLNNNRLTLETAFQATGVPSVVKTDGTGTVSGSISGTAASGMPATVIADLLHEVKALKSELNTMCNRNRSPNPPSSGGGGGGITADNPWNKWRQWNNWCHSCGCNLSHDSKDCKFTRRKAGHKDEATKDNPMGGYAAKDALWKKWWNPVTHKPHDKPE
jgi:hypothetical protein